MVSFEEGEVERRKGNMGGLDCWEKKNKKMERWRWRETWGRWREGGVERWRETKGKVEEGSGGAMERDKGKVEGGKGRRDGESGMGEVEDGV